jgi:hypothetical protein
VREEEAEEEEVSSARRSVGCAAALALAAPLLLAASAGAATITVSKTADETLTQADNGDCALREAVQAANTNAAVDDCDSGEPAPAVDTILLGDVPGPDTFVLANDAGDDTNNEADLDVDTAGGPIVFDGLGTLTTINANDRDRALDLFGPEAVTLQDLTVANGTVTNAGTAHDDGGGIRSAAGSLALANVRVLNNVVTGATSVRGGGIHMVSGQLSLSESIVSGNTVTRTGTSGIAAARGGGIAFLANAGGTIDRSTVSNNSVTATDDDVTEGGGISTTDSAFDLDITNSTISGNTVGAASAGSNRGAGISWDENGDDDQLRLTNVTMTSNSVSNGGLRLGGHLHVDGGTVLIAFTTLGTGSATEGDGIYTATGTVQMRGTVVSVGDEDCGGIGPPTSLGHNVERVVADNDCQFSQPTDVLTDATLLNPLADYGGPTLTQELVAGTVQDLVPAASCLDVSGNPLTADQRGVPRPSPSSSVAPVQCDPGAFEFVRCAGQQAYVIGTALDDELEGDNSFDGILGLGGNDTIEADEGDDRACGGDGDDTFIEDGDDGADGYLGEGGSDTVELFVVGGTVDLASGTVSGGTLDAFLDSVENAVGSSAPDTLIGDGGPNRLDGSFLNDTITGGAGQDTLLGGTHGDQLFARDGEADIVNCGGQTDTAQTDQLSLDTVISCETVDALPEPPPPPPAATTPTTTPTAPAAKRCKKGQKLRKGKCVKKKRKKKK